MFLVCVYELHQVVVGCVRSHRFHTMFVKFMSADDMRKILNAEETFNAIKQRSEEIVATNKMSYLTNLMVAPYPDLYKWPWECRLISVSPLYVYLFGLKGFEK